MGRQLEELAWPLHQLGEALMALVQKAGLTKNQSSVQNPEHLSGEFDMARWIEWAASRLDCEAESVDTSLRDLPVELRSAFPALLQISPSAFLAIVGCADTRILVLTPARQIRRIRLTHVCNALRRGAVQASRSEFECLLNEAEIPARKQPKALALLLDEQLGDKRFEACWILRARSSAGSLRLLRESGAVKNSAFLVVAHTFQYLLWLASWTILGQLSFAGHMDRGWLLVWALLLMTLVPFQSLSTWLKGLVAIGLGGFLKRRLLYGALRLDPEEMRHCGVGSFLGQALEAEAVETLALSGGIAAALAVLEIAVSGFILGRLAILLAVWCGITLLLAWRFLRRYCTWTDTRMDMTQDLVEAMVGNRTRLAQQRVERWHEEEDAALDQYFARSRRLDQVATLLISAIPRAWLVTGLACLGPDIVARNSSAPQTAVALGGILLAFTAFKRLTGSFADLAAAWVAARRIAPLFRAAARPEISGEHLAEVKTRDASHKVIEADRLSYRFRKAGPPILEDCSLVVRNGDRVLLEGASGSGKTTFASLLSGVRQPESGLLLVHGLDKHTLGAARWRQRVAAAPQFHENHMLTETLAFNLLMGRRWPPTQRDLEEAESICRDLGLGNLLDQMPSGLLQMVGEGGWQLSHGERSRVYIARALLQNADLVILDESFGALDPENLRVALECALERAKTLMVIAHP